MERSQEAGAFDGANIGRSATSTPVKMVRRSSVCTGGGLTPLPNEHPSAAGFASICTSPTPGRSRPMTPVGRSKQPDDALTRQQGSKASRAIPDVWEVTAASAVADVAADGPDVLGMLDDGNVTQALLIEMAQRRTELDATKKEVRSVFLNLRENLAQSKEAMPDFGADDEESNPSPSTPSDPAELKALIAKGLTRIQELDKLLKEKSTMAKALKRDRLSREASTTGSRNPTQPGTAASSDRQPDSDSDSDYEDGYDQADAHSVSASDTSSQDLELKSVHSLDTRTFITEPKFGTRNGGTRVKIGVQALRNASGIAPARAVEAGDGEEGLIQTETATNKRKGYKKGDFIQRNIVLGPDARYYSAMTEEECDRVEDILRRMDDEEGDDVESWVDGRADGPNGTECIHSRPRTDTTSTSTDAGASHMPRPMSTTSSAFFPDDPERMRLFDIDRKLQLIIPEPEWDAKSIIWSTPATSTTVSGHQTPLAVPRSMSMSLAMSRTQGWLMHAAFESRDIETVFHEREAMEGPEVLLKDELTRLNEIDERLRLLKEGEERPITRQDLDRLLYECMRSEADIQSRRSAATSDWDVTSLTASSRCSSRAQTEAERQQLEQPPLIL
ncbi:uncharacterized protein EV422DRAFT_110419 [Fimicolochytrium jonesii]|uniref:uncharacterized protein n=1 Tax=Fimicolochytrium jonesii TaxID=1396493 RepID=UPI0022FDCB77|nr:uncharacterized protein EV422DRAFT_110419 [Fimicolochytrium jonesii]KAI8819380.1 hypothetical protein EV422DRAFT_110419 [Fimicolochytrium jonesii]